MRRFDSFYCRSSYVNERCIQCMKKAASAAADTVGITPALRLPPFRRVSEHHM